MSKDRSFTKWLQYNQVSGIQEPRQNVSIRYQSYISTEVSYIARLLLLRL